MTDQVLQQQLDDVRVLARRTRDLFGHNLIEPPVLELRPEPVTE